MAANYFVTLIARFTTKPTPSTSTFAACNSAIFNLYLPPDKDTAPLATWYATCPVGVPNFYSSTAFAYVQQSSKECGGLPANPGALDAPGPLCKQHLGWDTAPWWNLPDGNCTDPANVTADGPYNYYTGDPHSHPLYSVFEACGPYFNWAQVQPFIPANDWVPGNPVTKQTLEQIDYLVWSLQRIVAALILYQDLANPSPSTGATPCIDKSWDGGTDVVKFLPDWLRPQPTQDRCAWALGIFLGSYDAGAKLVTAFQAAVFAGCSKSATWPWPNTPTDSPYVFFGFATGLY